MKARIYTKTGDLGETSLVGGTRVSKANPRLEAYGTLDELNSVLGVVRAQLDNLGEANLRSAIEARLQMIQNNLFNVGSHLACEDEKLQARLPGLGASAMSELESDMDHWEVSLPPLREFILPGGSKPAAHAHVARTICRRAEREVVRLRDTSTVEADHIIFLNRLSDWLFVLARMLNQQLAINDITWTKGQA